VKILRTALSKFLFGILTDIRKNAIHSLGWLPSATLLTLIKNCKSKHNVCQKRSKERKEKEQNIRGLFLIELSLP